MGDDGKGDDGNGDDGGRCTVRCWGVGLGGCGGVCSDCCMCLTARKRVVVVVAVVVCTAGCWQKCICMVY